ncbi:DUF559 domain-containing protein [Candidatus Gracilibacteria bacterium]|nr:DUF559 domain-containing protein [Candidatus Gracilibacteria bacterium]
MANFIFNNPKLKALRKNLRNNATENEKLLWGILRKRGLGEKFVRQYSVGKYILDFYCPQKKLGIEIDGSQHAKPKVEKYDKKRTFFLKEHGITVLRFWNNEITYQIEAVSDEIFYYLNNTP